jgi:hypothetical protein
MTSSDHATPTKHEYRRTSSVDSRPRRLRMRGGPLEGRTWTATIRVGERAFFGDGAWTTAGVYVVTDRIEDGDDGEVLSIAVPAFA